MRYRPSKRAIERFMNDKGVKLLRAAAAFEDGRQRLFTAPRPRMRRKVISTALLLLAFSVAAQAMTKAQMQTLATAITNAGYETHLIPMDATTWKVRARSSTLDVPIATVNNLAVAQGLSAFVAVVEFGPMTLAKMQTVSTAITNAGFNATASQVSPGVWTVRATSSDVDIPTSSAASLATAQAVAAMVAEVEYR